MLSYMVPSIEDKPPPVPSKNHLQLNLENAGLPPVPPKLTNGHANKRLNKTSSLPTESGKSVRCSENKNMIVTTSTTPSDTGNTIVKSSTTTTEGGNKIVKTTTITTEGGNKILKTSTVVTDSGNRIIKSTLSTESSASSLSSVPADVATTHTSSMTTHTDKPKPKLITNGGTKHQSLKRVSFGSSKGSMVETLIYESPLQEEPEVSPTAESPGTDSNTGSDCVKVPSKVKVSFFEQDKPLIVYSPEPSEGTDDLDAPFILSMTSASPIPDHAPSYNRQASPVAQRDVYANVEVRVKCRVAMPSMATSHGGILYYVVQVPKEETVQEKWTASHRYLEEKHVVTSTPKQNQKSTDSGWDNPFRPDGDLSREADEIVELIKGGKPITPTPGSTAPKLPSVEENGVLTPQTATPVTQSPVKDANGSTPVSNSKPPASPPGAVELQRATVVTPSDASQVEHVVLKKKPKCKCCVIQ